MLSHPTFLLLPSLPSPPEAWFLWYHLHTATEGIRQASYFSPMDKLGRTAPQHPSVFLSASHTIKAADKGNWREKSKTVIIML